MSDEIKEECTCHRLGGYHPKCPIHGLDSGLKEANPEHVDSPRQNELPKPLDVKQCEHRWRRIIPVAQEQCSECGNYRYPQCNHKNQGAAPVTPKSEAAAYEIAKQIISHYEAGLRFEVGKDNFRAVEHNIAQLILKSFPVSSPAGSSTAHGQCPDCKQALSGDDWLDREVHGRCSSQGVAEAAGSSTKEEESGIKDA